MKTIIHRSDCPMSFSLDFFGDKWAPLILRDIMFWDKSSYGEFLASEEKIATNILSDRLAMLYKEGFLVKNVSPNNKSKFIYTLTDKGIDLVPLMVELMIWGSRYISFCCPELYVEKVRTNKEQFIRETQEKLLSERHTLLKSLLPEE